MMADVLFPLLILTVSCFILSIIILATVASQLICNINPCWMVRVDADNTPIRSVQYLSILSVLSFVICLGAEIATLEYANANGQIPDHKISQDIIQSARWVSWAFGQFCIYLLFAANLYYTFKDTTLAISSGLLAFLICSIITFFVIQSTNAVLYVLYYNAIISQNDYVIISATMIV